MPKIPPFARDLAERVFWTAVQAGLGLVTVEALHIPTVYVVPVAAALSWLKGQVAKHIGNRNSAALIPGATSEA